MKPPNKAQVAKEITSRLAQVFGIDTKHVLPHKARSDAGYDLAVTVLGQCFVVEYLNTSSTGLIANALNRIQSALEKDSHEIFLLVVPFMGPRGKDLCEQHKASWMDLSGNANIQGPGLRLRIEGRSNRYLSRGRPSNVFAPKSSRVALQLLREPSRFQTQVEIASESGMDDGYVSKIVARLRQQEYLETNESGAIRPNDPDVLLNALSEAYDFTRHEILRGHIPARSGTELVERVANAIGQKQSMSYALTGLGAAWAYTHFAAFRLATFYVTYPPSDTLLKLLSFSDEPKGANVWFVVPKDLGVLLGSDKRDGINCVSPVQTYLDLAEQPERAKDAAIELRRKFLDWKNG